MHVCTVLCQHPQKLCVALSRSNVRRCPLKLGWEGSRSPLLNPGELAQHQRDRVARIDMWSGKYPFHSSCRFRLSRATRILPAPHRQLRIASFGSNVERGAALSVFRADRRSVHSQKIVH